MNFITSGAVFDRASYDHAPAIRAAKAIDRRPALPQPPYAFLSARDLRGLVAAMVD